MKKILIIRCITTVLFFVVLFAFSIMNFLYGYEALEETIRTEVSHADHTLKEKIVTIENTVNDNVIYQLGFVEFYGLIQKTLGKNEVSNFKVVQDVSGKLHYTYFDSEPNEVDVIGERLIALEADVEQAGSKLIYVMPPDKIVEGVTKFAVGIPDTYDNVTADHFLEYIEKEEIEYLDLRDTLDESGIDPSEYFYATDHHWQIQTAFWASTQIIEYLESNHHLVLDPKDYYTNINHYNQILFPDSFLGAMGRDTGIIYAGVEDFTVIYPKFQTNYAVTSHTNAGEPVTSTGEFENVLLRTATFLDTNLIMEVANDKYFSYLGGNYPFQTIENLDRTKGLKVLFIKDSFFVPTAAFLSTVCSKIDLLDPRFYQGRIRDVIAQGGYDYVFVAFSPPNLTTEFFRFHPEIEE